MAELVESIKVNGVLTPVLIRPSKKTRGYEMISGHRRLHAAGLAGLSMIPAIVREMDDDTAVLAMVDANVQREELLPSEKAFAFKMKMDAMRHQGTSRHEVEKSEKWTCEKVGEAGGIGGRQVQRYIRLTELIPELIEFVDKKKIQLSLGVDISYIDKEIQKWIYEYIKENGTIKPKQISALREECEKGVMTQPKTNINQNYMNENKSNHILSYSGQDAIRCDEMPDQALQAYGEIIRKNIEYDSLLITHNHDQELVEGIYNLILETVMSKRKEILIASERYPAELVKDKFLKLNYSHIDYVIQCLHGNTTKVKNIKKYLLAALFNAPSTMDGYYCAEVNHDMPMFAR